MRGCSGVERELFRFPQHDDRTSYNLADPCKRIYAVPAFPEVNIIATLEGKFRISSSMRPEAFDIQFANQIHHPTTSSGH